MAEKDVFNLGDFLTDSLSLQANNVPATRSMPNTTFRNPLMKLYDQDPLDILGEGSFSEPKRVPGNAAGTPIQEFFRGKNVLISGGTGFIGKILTEKLLRSLPNIGNIYLLVRAKRGKTAQERFEQLLKDQIFRRMKAEVLDWRSKLHFLSGDLLKSDLGLSTADTQLLTDCIHVVFHSAADVRFMEPLRTAVESNVLGSRRLLGLARKMRNLESYVHVSTAYSYCVHRKIPESIPEIPVVYTDVLSLVQNHSDEELEKLGGILHGWPNTYTFSKALCEKMIQAEAKEMPICIFRPSVGNIRVSTYIF